MADGPDRRRRGRRRGAGRAGAAVPERAGAAAGLVHPGSRRYWREAASYRRAPRHRDHAGRPGGRARDLQLGPADRRAPRTAGAFALGAGQPRALHRRRRQRPVSGAEDAIESGCPRRAWPLTWRGPGIRYVLVRNDLDPAQIGYTPPTLVHAALRASGFTRVAAFGPPSPVTPSDAGTALQVQRDRTGLSPGRDLRGGQPGRHGRAGARACCPPPDHARDGGPARVAASFEGQRLLSTGPPSSRRTGGATLVAASRMSPTGSAGPTTRSG